MSNKMKIIDLFCGVGGLSYGFARDDFFEIVAANDKDEHAIKGYSLNHPNVKVYNKNIKDFSVQDIKEDLNIDRKEIDIIIGGPPCQSYSTLGKRIMDDSRGNLFKEYFRMLEEFNPNFFIFENVKGLLSMKNGELIKTIKDLFESLDYNVQYKILNAADYGIPQLRERVILVGTKKDKPFSYPTPTHYNPEDNNLFNNSKPYITLKAALSDLPSLKSGEEKTTYSKDPETKYQEDMRQIRSEKLEDHKASKHGENLIKLMEALPDGGTPLDIPKELRPTSGFKNTYCKLWWEKPSYTITRNFGTPSSSRCIHPIDSRGLTTREGARLQSFPDTYRFYGPKTKKNLQIGNAVPPKLSIALANSLKEYFLNK